MVMAARLFATVLMALLSVVVIWFIWGVAPPHIPVFAQVALTAFYVMVCALAIVSLWRSP